jgi:uncharacterized protein YdaU (DUF1376 family)
LAYVAIITQVFFNLQEAEWQKALCPEENSVVLLGKSKADQRCAAMLHR